MARFARLSLAVLMVISVASCARYSLVQPQRTAVKSGFTVEPGYDLTQPTIDPEWLKEKNGE